MKKNFRDFWVENFILVEKLLLQAEDFGGTKREKFELILLHSTKERKKKKNWCGGGWG